MISSVFSSGRVHPPTNDDNYLQNPVHFLNELRVKFPVIFDVYLKIFLLVVEYNPNRQNILLFEYYFDELDELKYKTQNEIFNRK
jgi:hypothetical protein